MASKLKGAKMTALVSDSIAAAGLPDGEYEFGGQKVYVREGRSALESGRLAGSTIGLCDAVRNMVRLAGFTVPEAVEMASATPSRIIGASNRKGSLAPGMDVLTVGLDTPLPRRLRTNSWGFRNSADFPREKPPGELRVLSLGDSYSTGYHLGQERFLGPLLERRLGSALAGRTVRLLQPIEEGRQNVAPEIPVHLPGQLLCCHHLFSDFFPE